jgi:hypothetical protein
MKGVVGRVGPVAAGVGLGLAILAPVVTAAKVSDEARACGAEGNQVQAEFDLDEARGIWNRFPALGVTPELEGDSRPAHVVVFRGQFDPRGLAFGTEREPPMMSRVLCVVQEDGTVNLYYDVSRTGSGFED